MEETHVCASNFVLVAGTVCDDSAIGTRTRPIRSRVEGHISVTCRVVVCCPNRGDEIDDIAGGCCEAVRAAVRYGVLEVAIPTACAVGSSTVGETGTCSDRK